MTTDPHAGAVRRSLLASIRQRVNELPKLIDALDLETLPERHQEQIEQAEAENDKLKAWLCVCPPATPERVETDEQCPIHGEPGKALTLRAVMAERDEARSRIANARAEIWRQDVAAQLAPHDAAIVGDALAAVETHLMDPGHRPATTNGASQ